MYTIYREVAAELEAKKRQPATASASSGGGFKRGGGSGRDGGGDSSDSSGDEDGTAQTPQASASKQPPKRERKKLEKPEHTPWHNAVVQYITKEQIEQKGWAPPYTKGINVTDVTTKEEIRLVRFHKTCDDKYHQSTNKAPIRRPLSIGKANFC